jgi:hypothetical protein
VLEADRDGQLVLEADADGTADRFPPIGVLEGIVLGVLPGRVFVTRCVVHEVLLLEKQRT